MAVTPPDQLSARHIPLSRTSSLHQPQLFSRFVTAFLFACAVLIAWCIFIEVVAALTKRVMDRIAKFVASELYSQPNDAYPPEDLLRTLQPHVVIHMLIDQTCPVTSHTPSEIPKCTEESPRKVLPEQLCSPCGICDSGIGMGELKRTLPCDHSFHARCIDNVCIKESFQNFCRAKGGIECPRCKFVVVSTPALVKEFIPSKLEMIV